MQTLNRPHVFPANHRGKPNSTCVVRYWKDLSGNNLCGLFLSKLIPHNFDTIKRFHYTLFMADTWSDHVKPLSIWMPNASMQSLLVLGYYPWLNFIHHMHFLALLYVCLFQAKLDNYTGGKKKFILKHFFSFHLISQAALATSVTKNYFFKHKSFHALPTDKLGNNWQIYLFGWIDF